MEKVRPVESPGSSKLLIRILIGTFVLFTIVLVLVAVILILTQKPVDLSPVAASSPAPPGKRKELARPFRKYASSEPKPYRKFTFNDLFSGKIFLKDAYSLTWTKNGSLLKNKDEFFQMYRGSVAIDPITFSKQDYLEDSALQNTMSSNEKYAYGKHLVRQGYRHSNGEVYYVYRIENGTVLHARFPVGPKGTGTEVIHNFQWNPDRQRNDFIFVYKYNIYYQSDPERPGTAVQISENGYDLLRYGVADWLYEEEIFQSSNAVWWSESGRYVAYMRFDDRAVNKVFVPSYRAELQYPSYEEIPYPKAGVESNPLTTLYIWDRQQNKAVAVMPPTELTAFNQSYYIFSNTWISLPKTRKELGNDRLLTVWSNREQNTLYLTLCNEVDCLLTFTQTFVMNGQSMWAEPTEFKTILASISGFFILLPHLHTDGRVYNHIAHIEIETSGRGRISSWHGGAYDVKELKGYDASQDILTFVSAGGGVGTHKLYRVTGAASTQSVISSISSYIRDCEHGSFDVSPNGNIAVLSCNRLFKNTQLWIMDVANPERKKLLDGDDDIPLPFDVPDIIYETAQLPSGYEAHIGIMRPPNFDSTRKYPVLVDLYGGPNSNRVKRVTPGPNLIHYCSNYGMVVIWIDGRGTGNRGWHIKLPVFKNLGQFEAMDTLDSIRYLTTKYSYIDRSNIATYGWSYGGFLSTHVAMLDRGNLVKCAIAIAPVTDMIMYDSAYTERYMGMPEENPGGYNTSRLTNKASHLKNVRFMLAHGEADDNVHYQHSALLSEALQREHLHFKQIVYGNQDHSLGGMQRHLFKEVGIFLADCFNLPRE